MIPNPGVLNKLLDPKPEPADGVPKLVDGVPEPVDDVPKPADGVLEPVDDVPKPVPEKPPKLPIVNAFELVLILLVRG